MAPVSAKKTSGPKLELKINYRLIYKKCMDYFMYCGSPLIGLALYKGTQVDVLIPNQTLFMSKVYIG